MPPSSSSCSPKGKHMKYFLTVLITSLSLFTLSDAEAKPFKNHFGEWREYNGAWLAVCPAKIEPDKAQFGYYYTHCWTVAGSLEDNGTGYPVYSFRIYQDRKTGKQELGFIYAAPAINTLDKTKPLKISVDGHPISSLSFTTDLERRYNVSNEYFIKDDKKRAKIIASLRKGANMTVAVPLLKEGVSSIKDVHIWLKGVTASEKFMKTYSSK